jgi:peroxiredoxin
MKTHPDMLPIGAAAPDFSLPGVDGRTYRLSDFQAPVFVYIQGCNHCPYVIAYLERLKAYAAEYGPKGVDFVMVNSNDVDQYEDDSFPAMQRFAKEHALPFPYLYDESQEVAKAYRTFRTPELLVFDRDRKLAYHGRIDDNPKEPDKATAFEFRDALEALLAGRPVPVAETFAVGCTVKWKPGNEPVL